MGVISLNTANGNPIFTVGPQIRHFDVDNYHATLLKLLLRRPQLLGKQCINSARCKFFVPAEFYASISCVDDGKNVRPPKLLVGSFRSYPEIASSISAQSTVRRAIGPTWSRESAKGSTPCLLTRPRAWLQPNHATVCSRVANRPTRISSNGSICEPSGSRNS